MKIKRKLQFCGAKVFEAPGDSCQRPPRAAPLPRCPDGGNARGSGKYATFQKKVTISMFTSRAEYAIIYIYGYNLKPQKEDSL